MKRELILLLTAGALLAFPACNRDDATVTAVVQGHVNLAMRSPDSEVQVAVHDGRATLTGNASSVEARLRAENAARQTRGIDSVDDQIAVATVLTGAAVPR